MCGKVLRLAVFVGTQCTPYYCRGGFGFAGNSGAAVEWDLLGDRNYCFCGNFAGFIAESGYHWRGCGHFWDSATVCDADRVFVDCTAFTIRKYGDCLSVGTDSGGRAFAAIRADELAADAIGINPTFYKVLAFTLGAILAGVVGAVSAHFLNT